jgi:hypothetical protein
MNNLQYHIKNNGSFLFGNKCSINTKNTQTIELIFINSWLGSNDPWQQPEIERFS